MTSLPVQCYRCGTDYHRADADPHPARCAVCGSSSAPPAGSLTVAHSTHWESADGRSNVWVNATDERHRLLEFEIATHAGRGKLVAVTADGVSIDPQAEHYLETLPAKIAAEIADHGITEVETANPERTKR